MGVSCIIHKFMKDTVVLECILCPNNANLNAGKLFYLVIKQLANFCSTYPMVRVSFLISVIVQRNNMLLSVSGKSPFSQIKWHAVLWHCQNILVPFFLLWCPNHGNKCYLVCKFLKGLCQLFLVTFWKAQIHTYTNGKLRVIVLFL